MAFIKWTDIEGLHNVLKTLEYRRDRIGHALPTVTYKGKVKLHGTNAGIRFEGGQVIAQSRGRDITVEDDNMGFAAWVADRHEKLAPAAENTEDDVVVIFGEFCGRGIMKGVSISQIDRKVFCIFAIQIGDVLMTEPAAIFGYLTAICDGDIDWVGGTDGFHIRPVGRRGADRGLLGPG